MNNEKISMKNIEEQMVKFEDIKKEYAECRKTQWKITADYLEQQARFTILNRDKRGVLRGGCGLKDYGGRGKTPRFSKVYDHTNWRYIDVEKEGKNLLLSLQTFDQDPSSKNYHVLMDRIGIYIYAPGSNKTADAIHRMLITNIDLPMDSAKLEELAGLLNKIVKNANYIEQAIKNIKINADMEKDKELKCLVPASKDNGLFHQLFAMYFDD